MTTGDLIEYIKSQLNKNISRDSIKLKLIEVGWHPDDIEEGFSIAKSSSIFNSEISHDLVNTEPVIEEFKKEKIEAVQPPVNIISPSEIKETKDPYREFPEGIDIDQLDPYNTAAPSLEKEQPKEEILEPVMATMEIPAEIPSVIDTEIQNINPVKIWTPISIKPKIVDSSPIKIEESKEDKEIQFSGEKSLEEYNLEIGGNVMPIVEKSLLNEDSASEIKTSDSDLMPTINKNPFPEQVKEPVIQEEIVSSNIPVTNNAFDDMPPRKQIVTGSLMNIQAEMIDIHPRNPAMIASYSQDILSAVKEPVISPKQKKNIILKILIAFIVFILVGGMIFAFVEGYIKVPWSNISLSVVKKDPKTIMINAPDSIAKLKGYKVDTTINISSPSLSSITTGLASGEVVTSKDRDSVSISSKGAASHLNGKLVFDYLLAFKSSILKSDINSNIKYDGNNLFVSVPDLKQILDKDAPAKATVSFTPDQLNMILGEFSPKIQDLIKKVDAYNLSSGKVPLYVKTEVSSIFKEFINSLTYVQKGNENIHGIDTYHYELTADRQSTKKLLISLSDLFIVKLSAEQKKELDETLGSSSLSAFDVWVGENDDNIYQIKFTLNTPLSTVLGLNDSGIAGNEVKLEWTSTYYDLDIPNTIKMPGDSVSMDTFVKGIKDLKIKNIFSSFRPQATSLRNAIGSYGIRSNPTGSCTNPNPGSLFSPKGHAKGADNAVSSISSSMNSILSATNGAGLCYSTSTAWALEVPLYSAEESSSTEIPNTPTFYCADSIGNIITLTSPILGTICK